MSYLLAGFVAASAVALAIRRRIELGRTYQVEATAERGECQVEASLERGWGSTTARGERGTTTLQTPPIFFLWAKVSASAQRSSEWKAVNPICMEWSRYTMCCTPCHRGMCEATTSLPHEWHRATAHAHLQPIDSRVISLSIPTKWDISLSQYCAQMKEEKSAQPPVSPATPEREFYSRKIKEEELPEAVDCDWDVPPSDDAVSSPISCGTTKRTTKRHHQPIISPLRNLPTRPPAPFRTSASADRGEVVTVARSRGSASAACHRGTSVVRSAPFPFYWHKVAVTAGRSCCIQEASLELQWGKWCRVAERAGGEARAQLAHTWHSTPHGYHSLERQPAVATATATYCPPSTPKMFEPVTPERVEACGAVYDDDVLPEAFDWEEGDHEDSHTSTPLSPLATRKTNRVKTPTTPVGTLLAPSPSLEAIPMEGRLTPIRIGSTNRVVLSPNGDGVPRTVPPPLPSTSHTLPGGATNRTKSPQSATLDSQKEKATSLPTALPAPLFPRHTPLSPVRQDIRSPERKTNRIPTPTRTMA